MQDEKKQYLKPMSPERRAIIIKYLNDNRYFSCKLGGFVRSDGTKDPVKLSDLLKELDDGEE